MTRFFKIGFVFTLVACVFTGALLAQSVDEDSVSLGDLARYLRQQKKHETQGIPVITNDNFSQILADAAKQRSNGALSFSIDSGDNAFKVSSPDVTCSLSFNANATALISDPFAARKMPVSELDKLDGPARMNGDDLEIAVHNGSDWTVHEITVGLTLIHRRSNDLLGDGSAHFLPAVVGTDNSADDEPKTADTTLIFHLRGIAPPLSTTVFREALNAPLPPDEDWHWAIVEAKATPPTNSPFAEAAQGGGEAPATETPPQVNEAETGKPAASNVDPVMPEPPMDPSGTSKPAAGFSSTPAQSSSAGPVQGRSAAASQAGKH